MYDSGQRGPLGLTQYVDYDSGQRGRGLTWHGDNGSDGRGRGLTQYAMYDSDRRGPRGLTRYVDNGRNRRGRTSEQLVRWTFCLVLCLGVGARDSGRRGTFCRLINCY